MAAAIGSAQQTAKTDPSTMQDPTLIDKLNQAITTARQVKNCTTPMMADDTDAVKQQTTELASETQAVTAAISRLQLAESTVTSSVSAKQQAAEQAAAEAAAKVGKGSTTYTDNQGYVYGITWTGMQLTATIDPTQGAPGTWVAKYTLAGSVTITNRTPNKQAPNISVYLFPMYPQSASTTLNTISSYYAGYESLSGGNVNGRSIIIVASWNDLVAQSAPVAANLMPGQSETQQIGSGANNNSEQQLTFYTTASAQEVATAFENPVAWGVTLPEGLSAAGVGSICIDGTGCFIAVSDSLAG